MALSDLVSIDKVLSLGLVFSIPAAAPVDGYSTHTGTRAAIVLSSNDAAIDYGRQLYEQGAVQKLLVVGLTFGHETTAGLHVVTLSKREPENVFTRSSPGKLDPRDVASLTRRWIKDIGVTDVRLLSDCAQSSEFKTYLSRSASVQIDRAWTDTRCP